MRNLFLNLWWALLFISVVGCKNTPATVSSGRPAVPETVSMKPTVVYVLRHAEKDTLDPANKDPELSVEGRARGEALRQLLEDQQIDALFATKYIRTKHTLEPLAEAHSLPIMQYEAADYDGLRQQLLEQYRGKTVVVAGHSNTLLPILEAFGVQRPVPDISEAEYSYLFRLTIQPDNTAVVETDYYGKK